MEHTLVHNVGPYLPLFAHQVVYDHLLVTSLVSIVSVEGFSDMGVIVLLLAFLVSITLTQTSCCLRDGVAGQYHLHS